MTNPYPPIFGSLSPFAYPLPQTCTWFGRSGHSYVHLVTLFTREFGGGAVNYLLVRATATSRDPLYWGQTEDCATRFGNHEKFEAAARLGANQIHFHIPVFNTEAERLRIETDLRHGNPTPLNEQSVPSGSALVDFSQAFGWSPSPYASRISDLLMNPPPPEPDRNSRLAGLLMGIDKQQR